MLNIKSQIPTGEIPNTPIPGTGGESTKWLLAKLTSKGQDTYGILHTMGFLDIVSNDKSFYSAIPPKGWTKMERNNHMYIYDDKNEQRIVQYISPDNSFGFVVLVKL